MQGSSSKLALQGRPSKASCKRPFRKSLSPPPPPAMAAAPLSGMAPMPDNLETCIISLVMVTKEDGSLELPMVRFRGLLNGSPASFVVSSGSTHSFIKKEAMERAGLHLSSAIPKLCDQRIVSAPSFTLGTVVAPVIIQGYASNLALEVLPSISVFDVVLGSDWTNSVMPLRIDVDTVSLAHRGRTITLTLATDAEGGSTA